jgi:hypothetical protein
MDAAIYGTVLPVRQATIAVSRVSTDRRYGMITAFARPNTSRYKSKR